MGKPKEKKQKERTCRSCSRRIQSGDPHGTCWEHLGEFHVCGKCVDLKPFRGFKSFQDFLAECWTSDKEAGVPTTAVEGAGSKVGDMEKSKTTSNGGPETSSSRENEAAQEGAQGDQDGGAHEGVDRLESGAPNGDSDAELVVTREEKVVSSEEEEDDVFGDARGKKMYRMFRSFEAEQSFQLDSFKREMHQELKDTLVAINESISRITEKPDKSSQSISLINDVDGGISDDTYDHDNDGYSVENDDATGDKPSQFEERVKNLDRNPVEVADKQQEIVVEDGSKTIKLALNLNLSDKGKEEKKDRKEEESFDKNSISLQKVVQACVPTTTYRGFFCDEAVLDLKKQKEDISSAASNWAAACYDNKIPDKTKFHEGMWAFVAAADRDIYTKAMVPGVKESTNDGTTKASVRFPRFPVTAEDTKKWGELVNEVLTSKKDNNQQPSVLALSVNKNYQFVDKDFQNIAMQPEIDLYVEEQCSYAGKKVPQLEKNNLAYRTAEGTKLQHRIIVFMRAALAAMKKQKCLQKPRDEDEEDGADFLNMAVVALEQATSDLRTVTARLHANGLKAVRRQVLEKTELGASDKEFLTKAPALPAKSLFANRAPGFSEQLKKEDQLKEARVAVSRDERRKRESQSSYQSNQKKPRFEEYRRDSSRGRGGNFFGGSRDRGRQPFRDYGSRQRGDNKSGPRGRGNTRGGGRSWGGGQGFSGRRK